MAKSLIRFAEQTHAFDAKDKLKLILFAAEVKPATYLHLRIKNNLHDKHRFEELLDKAGIVYSVSRAKGFEEITGIEDNAANWHFTGIWYGYDLFHTKSQKKEFNRYKKLIRAGKQAEADRVAGRLYGYPNSAVEWFIKSKNPKTLAQKFTYYQYYKQLHEIDRAFPFICHVPPSPTCKDSKRANEIYRKTIKALAPRFYKEYTKKRTYRCPIIVDMENSVENVWPEHRGHDYIVITTKPIEGQHWLISWLTRTTYPRGTILDAKITIQYDYARVDVIRKTGQLTGFYHKRHFTKL